MAALATVEDAASFGYLLDPVTGPGFLNRASERVRAYTRQDISRVTGDVVNVPVRNNQALLPQLPADKPTLVQIDGVTFLENTAWYWDPIQWRVMGIDPFIPSANFTGWWRETDGDRYITVTYSHGYVTVPDKVKEIVCAVAWRMSQTPGAVDGGVRQEGTAAVTVTFASETLSAGGNLTQSEKSALDLAIPRRRNLSMPMRTY